MGYACKVAVVRTLSPPMRSALLLGLSAAALAVACASTPAPTAGSSGDGPRSDAPRGTPTASATTPKPIPATPFSRIHEAPIGEDDRYARCIWSETTFRQCSGIADIRRTVQVCNDCLADSDCDAGKRCVDAVLPGPSVVHLHACASPDTPCFSDKGCPSPNACTLIDTSVVCQQMEICVAP